jgi:cytochrome c oxidase subunit 3
MGTLSHILTFRRDGGHNDHFTGGGDRRRPELPGYYERLRRYRIAVAVLLVGVTMIFVALSSAYVVRQNWANEDPHTHEYRVDWKPLEMPTTLLLINTGVLLLSSVTLEMARRNLHHRAVTVGLTGVPGVAVDPERSLPWLGITLALGFGFLGGQLMAWRALHRAGVFLASNPSSSFFYVLTGTHAIHLAGGLVALIYAASTTLLVRQGGMATRRVVVDATSWYWHFMAGLWIYVFALLHFAK